VPQVILTLCIYLLVAIVPASASLRLASEQTGAVWVPPVNETYGFDATGNRQSSALWDYGWDGRNKLVRARTKNHDAAVRGYDITFDYDAEGRRFKKNVTTYQNGSIVSQDRITFIWDGWDLIYELHQNPSGLTTLERKYVWGPDIANGNAGGAGGLYLIRETRGTQTKDYYPLYDGSGHVIGLADSNGVLVAEYAYGPFGELIHARGPMAQINPIRYATKYFDIETGLYYYGQRYLDPITGQWLSREPLGESESLNLYSYCRNDPINKVDVLGLAEISPDAPTNEEIQRSIDILVSSITGNEAWIYRKKGFGEWVVSLFDGEDQSVDQLGRDKQELRFLKAVLEIRNALGKDDYGTFKAWSEARKRFGDNLPERVVSHYLKPSDGLLTTPSFREFSRIQDATEQFVVGSSIGFLPVPIVGFVGGSTTRVPAVVEAAQAGRTVNGLEHILFPSYGGKPGFAPGMVINPFGQPAQRPPAAYSVAMEVQLAPNQFGMRRDRHFAIANQALRSELATNPTLANLVPYPEVLGRAPNGWTWQHATTNQAWNNVTGQGRPGVLQLVPKDQHTGGSEWWCLLHPLPNGGGGYSEWAIPAGAPNNY
jgi:RHS repeat-associated protein